MTDPRNLDSNAKPDIKTEQEKYPPRRLDDPAAVAEKENRFGIAMWIFIAAIGILFLIVVLWIAL